MLETNLKVFSQRRWKFAAKLVITDGVVSLQKERKETMVIIKMAQASPMSACS